MRHLLLDNAVNHNPIRIIFSLIENLAFQLLQRKRHSELGSLVRLTVATDASAVQLNDLARDGQAQAVAPGGLRGTGLIEFIEDALEVPAADPAAAVPQDELGRLVRLR